MKTESDLLALLEELSFISVMKVSSKRDKIELAELTKAINKKKRENVRKFTTQIINETVISGTSMTLVKRRLGRNQLYAIKKPDREVTYNKNEIIIVVEDFYRDLYNSNEQPWIGANAVTRDVPSITTEEIKRALKA